LMRNRLKSLRERRSDTLFKRHTCHILFSLYFSLGIVKMKRLIAKFDVKLPSYLLVNRPESGQLRYETKIGDCDIEILLMPDGGGRSKRADEEDWSFCISHAWISVARNEQVEPPPPRITEEGYIDYTVQDSYFENEDWGQPLTMDKTEIRRKETFFIFFCSCNQLLITRHIG